MAEVTNELMYELLKNMHQRMDRLESGLGEVKHEIVAIRLQAMSTQTDINNIYSITSRIDERLDRIERRLELNELAEALRPDLTLWEKRCEILCIGKIACQFN